MAEVKDFKKGNLLCSYLFPEHTSIIDDANADVAMKNDLVRLAMKWKEKGYIEHFAVADSDVISEKLKN